MSLHVEVVEPVSGEPSGTVLLSSGLGGAGSYWTPQIPALASAFRVVTYDHRGTGRSGGDVPEAGGIAAMTDDVSQIAERLGLGRFHFVGHALGGLIGLELAARRPDLIESLTVVNGWSRLDPQTSRCFDTRLTLLEAAGIEAYVKAQPLFLYPAAWISGNMERLAEDDRHGTEHFQGRGNLLRRIEALRAFDREDDLPTLRTPTLVIAARDDLLVPYTRSTHLAQAMPNARLALRADGAHAVNITRAQWFDAVLGGFLRSPQPVLSP